MRRVFPPDLDAHGRWVEVPAYGWVWSPNGVGTDWAPYRNGHYWRPALVAFFGFGQGVGWVPLAPNEPFHPWYGRGYYSGDRNTVHIDSRVNIVNNANITTIYRNARAGNGVSGIDSNDFVRGRMARPIHVNDAEIQRAALVRGQVPVTPVADSLRLSDRQVRTPNLPRSEPTRFATRRPAPTVELRQDNLQHDNGVWQRFPSHASEPSPSRANVRMNPPVTRERSASRSESRGSSTPSPSGGERRGSGGSASRSQGQGGRSR